MFRRTQTTNRPTMGRATCVRAQAGTVHSGEAGA